MRRGSTVTIDNELGHILRLTRWDDDHLSVEVLSSGESWHDNNVLAFQANFGIAGHTDDLAKLFTEGS